MKKLISIFLVLSNILVLTACGGQKTGDGLGGFAPTLDPETECSITIAGSYENFEALEAEFDRFNEIYPNVELKYVKFDDYNNILPKVLESDDRPDIFFTYTWMIGNDKYDSIFTHTEDLSDPSVNLNLDCIRSGLIDHDKDGHVNMVPVFSRSYGILVNNDLFEKEGISVPVTWDGLLDTCKQFKDKGYKNPMMGYSLKSSGCLMYIVAYPMFAATLAENPDALSLANDLDPKAGEYMRPALEAVDQLVNSGCIDINECDKIEDNYTEVILRFFEGDVPMMICNGDTVSGTRKREGKSESFSASPFEYTFMPIPLTGEGGYFIDSPSIEFSVNKDSSELEMTNEFMRFLITNDELEQMASVKRLVPPTNDFSFDSVYAPFGQVPSERIISPEALGITDALTVQIKEASFGVGKGQFSIDDAISMYGSFE